MQIVIVQDGQYSIYGSVRFCRSGDVVSVANWYGTSLIESGLAKPYQPEPVTKRDELVTKRLSLPEVEEATVAAAKANLQDADLETIEAALAKEKAGSNRVTLVDWLEKRADEIRNADAT